MKRGAWGTHPRRDVSPHSGAPQASQLQGIVSPRTSPPRPTGTPRTPHYDQEGLPDTPPEDARDVIIAHLRAEVAEKETEIRILHIEKRAAERRVDATPRKGERRGSVATTPVSKALSPPPDPQDAQGQIALLNDIVQGAVAASNEKNAASVRGAELEAMLAALRVLGEGVAPSSDAFLLEECDKLRYDLAAAHEQLRATAEDIMHTSPRREVATISAQLQEVTNSILTDADAVHAAALRHEADTQLIEQLRQQVALLHNQLASVNVEEEAGTTRSLATTPPPPPSSLFAPAPTPLLSGAMTPPRLASPETDLLRVIEDQRATIERLQNNVALGGSGVAATAVAVQADEYEGSRAESDVDDSQQLRLLEEVLRQREALIQSLRTQVAVLEEGRHHDDNAISTALRQQLEDEASLRHELEEENRDLLQRLVDLQEEGDAATVSCSVVSSVDDANVQRQLLDQGRKLKDALSRESLLHRELEAMKAAPRREPIPAGNSPTQRYVVAADERVKELEKQLQAAKRAPAATVPQPSPLSPTTLQAHTLSTATSPQRMVQNPAAVAVVSTAQMVVEEEAKHESKHEATPDAADTQRVRELEAKLAEAQELAREAHHRAEVATPQRVQLQGAALQTHSPREASPSVRGGSVRLAGRQEASTVRAGRSKSPPSAPLQMQASSSASVSPQQRSGQQQQIQNLEVQLREANERIRVLSVASPQRSAFVAAEGKRPLTGSAVSVQSAVLKGKAAPGGGGGSGSGGGSGAEEEVVWQRQRIEELEAELRQREVASMALSLSSRTEPMVPAQYPVSPVSPVSAVSPASVPAVPVVLSASGAQTTSAKSTGKAVKSPPSEKLDPAAREVIAQREKQFRRKDQAMSQEIERLKKSLKQAEEGKQRCFDDLRKIKAERNELRSTVESLCISEQQLLSEQKLRNESSAAETRLGDDLQNDRITELEAENTELQNKVDELVSQENARSDLHSAQLSALQNEATRIRQHVDSRIGEHLRNAQEAGVDNERVREELTQAVHSMNELRTKSVDSERACRLQLDDICILREKMGELLVQLDATQTDLASKTRDLHARRQEVLRVKHGCAEEIAAMRRQMEASQVEAQERLLEETSARVKLEQHMSLSDQQLEVSKEKAEQSRELELQAVADAEVSNLRVEELEKRLETEHEAYEALTEEKNTALADLQRTQEDLDIAKTALVKIRAECDSTVGQTALLEEESNIRCAIVVEGTEALLCARSELSAELYEIQRVAHVALEEQHSEKEAAIGLLEEQMMQQAAQHEEDVLMLRTAASDTMRVAAEEAASVEQSLRIENEELRGVADQLKQVEDEAASYLARLKASTDLQSRLKLTFNQLRVKFLLRQTECLLLGRYFDMMLGHRAHPERRLTKTEYNRVEHQRMNILYYHTSLDDYEQPSKETDNDTASPSEAPVVITQQEETVIELVHREHQIATLREEIASVKLIAHEEVATLQKEVRSVQELAEDREEELSRLAETQRSEDVTLRQEAEQQLCLLEDTQSQLLQLEVDNAEKNAIITKLKAELAAIEVSIQEDKIKIEMLTDDLDLSEQRQRSTEAQLELSQTELQLVQESSGERQKSLAEEIERRSEVEAMMKEANDAHAATSVELDRNTERMLAMSAELDAARQDLSELMTLRTQLSDARTAQEHLGKQLAVAQDEVALGKRRLATEFERRQGKEGEITKLQEQLIHLHETEETLQTVELKLSEENTMRMQEQHRLSLADEQLNAAQEREEDLEKVIHEVRDELAAAQQELASSASSLEATKAHLATSERALMDNTTALYEADHREATLILAQGEYLELRDIEMTHLTDHIAILERVRLEYEKDMAESTKSQTTLSEKLAASNEKLQLSETQCNALSNELSDLKKKEKEASRRASGLSKELKEIKAEMVECGESAEQMVDTNKKEMASQGDKLEKLNQQLRDAAKKEKETAESITSLGKELEQLRAECTAWEASCEEMDAQKTHAEAQLEAAHSIMESNRRIPLQASSHQSQRAAERWVGDAEIESIKSPLVAELALLKESLAVYQDEARKQSVLVEKHNTDARTMLEKLSESEDRVASLKTELKEMKRHADDEAPSKLQVEALKAATSRVEDLQRQLHDTEQKLQHAPNPSETQGELRAALMRIERMTATSSATPEGASTPDPTPILFTSESHSTSKAAPTEIPDKEPLPAPPLPLIAQSISSIQCITKEVPAEPALIDADRCETLEREVTHLRSLYEQAKAEQKEELQTPTEEPSAAVVDTERCDALEREVADLRTLLDQAKKGEQSVQREKASSSENPKVHDVDSMSLEQQLRHACLRGAEMETKVMEAHAKIEQLESSHADFAKKWSTREDDFTASAIHADIVLKELKECTEKLKLAEEDLKTSEEKNSKLEAEALTHIGETTGMQSKMDSLIETHRISQGESEARVNTAEAEVQRCHAQAEHAAVQLEEAQQAVQIITSQMAEERGANVSAEEQLTEAESRIASLETKLLTSKDTQGEYDLLSRKLAEVEKQLLSAKESFTTSEASRLELQSESLALKARLSTTEDALSSSEEQADSLQASLAERENEVEDLAELDTQQKEMVLELQKTVAEMKQAIQDMARVVAEKEKQHNSDVKLAAASSANADNLNTALEIAENELAARLEEVAELIERTVTADEHAAAAVERAEAAEELATMTTEELSEAGKVTANLTNSLEAADAEIASLQKTRQTLLANVSSLETSLNTTREELEALQASYETSKENAESSSKHITELEEALDTSSSAEGRLTLQLSSVQTKLATAEDSLEEKLNDVFLLKGTIDEMEATHSAVEASRDALQQELAIVQQQRDEMGRRADISQKTLDEKMEGAAAAQKQTDDMTAELARLRAGVDRAKTRAVEVEQRFEEASFQIRALRDQLSEKSSELERMRRELAFHSTLIPRKQKGEEGGRVGAKAEDLSVVPGAVSGAVSETPDTPPSRMQRFLQESQSNQS